MTIERLTEQLEQRDALIAELSEAVDKLRGELEWCKRQLFGRKSERYEDPNQPKLFDTSASTVQDAADADESVTVPVAPHERRFRGRGKRQPIPDHLRRERIVHDLPESQRIDPATGEPLLMKIGEQVSEKLAFKPGEVYVERHVRIKYRRREPNLAVPGSEPEVVIAPPPEAGLAKSIAAPSLLAEVAVRKYADHLPLDRLVKIFHRHGVELSKASMCRWMQEIGELATPLLALMKRRMLEHSRIIGHDDTPVRQQEPGSGRCRTSRFWTAMGQVGTAGHYVLFDYTQNRSRAGPERWFRCAGHGDHQDDQALFVGGELQCDAYAGYGSGGQGGLLDPEGPWRMVHVGCWAHARRKFHDARLNAPAEACHALGLIRRLYAIEATVKDASDNQRRDARQARARPKVDAFFGWCADQQATTLPRSAIGQALTYALNQETSLRRYLDAGHRPIGRVEMWRGGVGSAYLLPPLSSGGASRAEPCSVSTSRSPNRTCGFPASGSHPGLRPSHSAWPCATRAA
jgi:transposase